MAMSLSDPATGWSFSCLTDTTGTRPPPGGLVLQQMLHDGHNFCRDLRLIGIRLRMDKVRSDGTVAATTSHFLPLSDPPFTVGTIGVLRPVPVSMPAAMRRVLPGLPPTVEWMEEAAQAQRFSRYFSTGLVHIAFGVRCDYTLPSSYVSATWPNCQLDRLEVSQRFVFSPYGNNPRHEPSGGLSAARCHPMTRFDFIRNPSVDTTRDYFRVASIRFDYRLHLFIDRHYHSPSAQPSIGNNAGLFADHEILLGGVRPTTNAFAAVEKPLVREVATLGLDEGTRFLGPRSIYGPTTAQHGWDNVHWWGTRGPGNPIISAPGAFHAAHSHWRWGGAGSALRSTIPEIDGTGGPSGFPARRWGVDRLQVDPNIWMQTIRVGVTKNAPSLNPSTSGVTLQSLCPDDWESLFTGLRTSPDDIEAGDDIVLWYSVEVPRQTYFPADYSMAIFPMKIRPGATYSAVTPGTVFLHGLFFAHDAEQSGLLVGSTSPEHYPRTPAQIRTLTGTAAWKRTW